MKNHNFKLKRWELCASERMRRLAPAVCLHSRISPLIVDLSAEAKDIDFSVAIQSAPEIDLSAGNVILNLDKLFWSPIILTLMECQYRILYGRRTSPCSRTSKNHKRMGLINLFSERLPI